MSKKSCYAANLMNLYEKLSSTIKQASAITNPSNQPTRAVPTGGRRRAASVSEATMLCHGMFKLLHGFKRVSCGFCHVKFLTYRIRGLSMKLI